MAESVFDDARLDDPGALVAADAALRELALTGARIRLDAAHIPCAATLPAPRGLVVVGAESRLLRNVLENACPVPMVAWNFPGLPGWAGPLDLVVVLASDDADAATLAAVAEATRRGCYLLVAAPPDSALAAGGTASGTLHVPTPSADPLAAAVAVLRVLHAAGLGPDVSPEPVALAADLVAEECTPHKDVSGNPAKETALALADAQPLLWGSSVLASRAARRVAEALRRSCGRPALAASAEELEPVLAAARPTDLFDDPSEGLRPVVVALCDAPGALGSGPGLARLTRLADQRGLRVHHICCDDPEAGPVDRYVSLLLQGRYAACYLSVGLGRDAPASDGLWVPGR